MNRLQLFKGMSAVPIAKTFYNKMGSLVSVTPIDKAVPADKVADITELVNKYGNPRLAFIVVPLEVPVGKSIEQMVRVYRKGQDWRDNPTEKLVPVETLLNIEWLLFTSLGYVDLYEEANGCSEFTQRQLKGLDTTIKKVQKILGP
jgi:hypothetical protein